MINNANKWREFWLRRNHVDPGFLPLAILFYFVFVLLLFGWLQSRHKIYIIIVLERKGERGRESALFKKKKRSFGEGQKNGITRWWESSAVRSRSVPFTKVYVAEEGKERRKKNGKSSRQRCGHLIRAPSVSPRSCVCALYICIYAILFCYYFFQSLSFTFFSFSPLALIFDVLHIA